MLHALRERAYNNVIACTDLFTNLFKLLHRFSPVLSLLQSFDCPVFSLRLMITAEIADCKKNFYELTLLCIEV